MPATGAKYHKADLDNYAPSVDFPPQAEANEIFSGMLPPSIHDEINGTHQARSLRAVSAGGTAGPRVRTRRRPSRVAHAEVESGGR